MKTSILPILPLGAFLLCTPLQATEPPHAVSPGSLDATVSIESRCPAFSWSAVPEAVAYRVVVYHVPGQDASRATAVIEKDLPRWALSWTPPLERCLAAGETYAWRVGAALPEREPAWSEPAWFEVAGTEFVVTPRLVDELVRQLAVRTAADGDDAAGAQGARPVRGRGPLPGATGTIPTEGRGASVFSVGNGGAVTAGAVTADSFTGDGSGLSSLAAASLTGTVAVANGGTGADTAAGARTNLDAAATTHTHGASGVAGLTSGRVLFGDGSGTIGQDGAFVWDNTNKRLGLGAPSPNQQLELSGNLRMPATAATLGTPTAGVLFLGSDRFLHNYGFFGTGGNTFVGLQAGNFTITSLTGDAGNTGVGFQALPAITTGDHNTATGYQSLYSNAGGYENTASGWGSLFSNTTGNYNTAVGYGTLTASTGDANTALGWLAGSLLTTGHHNIDIGNRGFAAEAHTIRIGTAYDVDEDYGQNRTFVAGIYGVVTGAGEAIPVVVDFNGQLGTISSSIRTKRDVTDMGEASSKLMELRPVTFRYKAHSDGPLQYGLIAEEVEEVMPELVVHDATGQPETVAYHELPALLLNELQKQHATIQAQQAEIEALRSQLDELLARAQALEEGHR